MASILRLRPFLRPPPSSSSLFLRLPSSYRSFHATPRPQFLDPSTLFIGTHELLQFAHSSTGLPWAAVIPLAALTMRLTVLLPIAIYTRRKAQKMRELNPLLQAWARKSHTSIIKNNRAATPGYVQKKVQQAWTFKRWEVYKRWKCQMWKQFIFPIAQVPIWLVLIETIRRMCGEKEGLFGLLIPNALVTSSKAAVTEGTTSDMTLVSGSGATDILTSSSTAGIGLEPTLATEGMLWFPNLLELDPIPLGLGLPTVLSGVFLLNIAGPSSSNQAKSAFRRRFRRVMVIVAFCIPPLAAQMPTAILLYWISSGFFGLVQYLCLDRLMPVPPPISPAKGDTKALIQ